MKVDLMKLRVAGIFGFLAVGLGAMGAHGLKTKWEKEFELAQVEKLLELWKTASTYHIVHAVVLLALALVFANKGQGRWTFLSFVVGTLLFSGTLYAYALTGIKTFALITPIGGVLLMVGWFLLILSSRKAFEKSV